MYISYCNCERKRLKSFDHLHPKYLILLHVMKYNQLKLEFLTKFSVEGSKKCSIKFVCFICGEY